MYEVVKVATWLTIAVCKICDHKLEIVKFVKTEYSVNQKG